MRLWLLPRELAVLLVRAYQKTLSPDHGPLRHLYPYGYCRHHPTCSAYAIQTLRHDGLLMGTFKTCWRLLGCNPWRRPDDERIRQALNL